MLSPLIGPFPFCQPQSDIDSLLVLLKSDVEDTNKVIHLVKLSRYASTPDAGILYGEQALQLSNQLNYTAGQMRAWGTLGSHYENKRDRENWLNAALMASLYAEKLADEAEINMAYGGILHACFSQGNYPLALETCIKGLKIAEKTRNKHGMAFFYLIPPHLTST